MIMFLNGVSHALVTVKVFNNPAKTLVGIQGCGEIAKVYMAGLPGRYKER